MERMAFRNLPTVAKISIALTGFMGWVMIEEFVIDRNHLGRYLPFYRIGDFCVYDVLTLCLIAFLYAAMNRRGKTD